jgi:hypothetical protein
MHIEEALSTGEDMLTIEEVERPGRLTPRIDPNHPPGAVDHAKQRATRPARCKGLIIGEKAIEVVIVGLDLLGVVLVIFGPLNVDAGKADRIFASQPLGIPDADPTVRFVKVLAATHDADMAPIVAQSLVEFTEDKVPACDLILIGVDGAAVRTTAGVFGLRPLFVGGDKPEVPLTQRAHAKDMAGGKQHGWRNQHTGADPLKVTAAHARRLDPANA